MKTINELEVGKYYQYGTDRLISFIEDTGRKVESYPNVHSGIYKVLICQLNTMYLVEYEKELIINPEYPIFTDVDVDIVKTFIKKQEGFIKTEQSRVEQLKKILNQQQR